MAPGPARAPDDLYGLPLDEFTPARDALAKELRGAGDKEGAAEVKARRKPSVASWAINQAARRHGSDVGRLLAAGADSREAQSQALAGDAGALREATRTLNEEVERVADLAVAELSAAGRDASPATRDRIATTLRAAAVDEEGGRRLERGTLAEDLEPAGFGVFDLAAGAGPAPARAAAPRPAARKRSKEEDEALAAARRELRRAESEADGASARARRRAERAEAAERQAIEAHRAAEAARAEAEEAAAESEAARRRAEEAAARLADLDSG